MPGGKNLCNSYPWHTRDGKCVKPDWGWSAVTKSHV